MNTFKKGDRFKALGCEYTVNYTSGPYVYYTADGIHRSIHSTSCTLLPQRPDYKPGDIVRYLGGAWAGGAFIKNRAYTVREFPVYRDSIGIVQDELGSRTNGLHYKFFELVRRANPEPATLGDILSTAMKSRNIESLVKEGKLIEAIKEYRALHGTDLREARDAVFAIKDSLETPKTKFKAGDRVKHIDDANDIGTVVSCDNLSARVRWTKDGTISSPVGNLFLVPESTPTIVVRYDAGVGHRPNDNPRVHASAEEATKEAARLARKNPGVRFDTFALVNSTTATAPVEGTVTTVAA